MNTLLRKKILIITGGLKQLDDYLEENCYLCKVNFVNLLFPENHNTIIYIGKEFGGTMIIKTNGDIETNDTLRVCKSGITKVLEDIENNKKTYNENKYLESF